MKIKNENIFLNLNEGEEIVYVADKNISYFYFFVLIPILLIGSLIFLLTKLFLTQNIPMLVSNYSEMRFLILGIILAVFLFGCIIYKYVLDCFFTDIILTNQRFLISVANKITSLNYKDIKGVSNSYTTNYNRISTSGIRIDSNVSLTRGFNPLFNTSNKNYTIFFVNWEILKTKILEIYPNIINPERETSSKGNWTTLLFLILFLLIKIFLHS